MSFSAPKLPKQAFAHGEPYTISNGSLKREDSRGSRIFSGGHKRTDSRLSQVSDVIDAALKDKVKPKYGFRWPLCCPNFKLPSWRFSSKLEWKSQSRLEGRFIPIGPTSEVRESILEWYEYF